jgi:hypothetical protein
MFETHGKTESLHKETEDTKRTHGNFRTKKHINWN